MKKLLFILMLIPFIGFGQSKIRNTQITSGNNPNETFLKSDGATNAVWDSAKISGLKIDATLNLKEYSIYAEGQQLPLSNGGCQISTLTDNGNGTVTLGTGDYHLSANVSGKGSHNYTLSGGTFTLTDGSQNYIVADYNSGSPYIHVITDVTLINETTIVPIYTIFRNGTYLHTQNWDALGIALSNKIHQSIVKTQRYRRESGLSLSEYGTHNLNLSVGRIWTGAVPITLDAIATSTDNIFFFRHITGVWTPNLQTAYNFTHYDNGTDLIELTSNRYAVNWVFRGVESQKHLYIVAGTGDYTESQAITATLPAIPIAISSHAVLVAKLIVQKNAATASSIQSAFDTQFGLSAIQSHGDLTGRDVVDSHPAGAITNTPYSTTSATTVQGAINELTDEKVQVSPASAQSGNIWMGGSIRTTQPGESFRVSEPSSTSPYSIAFENAGGAVYFGVEGSTAGGYFTNSNAYEAVIYGANSLFITSPTRFASTVNSTGYLINGNNLFSSLTTNAYTKWDGTKFVDAVTPTGATNLSYTPSATNGIVASDTGTDATIPAGSTINASLMLPADKTKLDGLVANTMTTGWVAKWDGTKFVDFYNPAVYALSGTTPTWNVNNGVNATLTTTGVTTITMSNLVAGTGGYLTVSSGSLTYYITFSGYTFKITRAVWKTGDQCYVSGSTKTDIYHWSYNGSTVTISGTLDVQ